MGKIFPLMKTDGRWAGFWRRVAAARHAVLNRALSTLYERPMELMPHNAMMPAVGVVLWVMRENGVHIVMIRKKNRRLGIPLAAHGVTYFEREDRVKSLLVGAFGGVFARTLALDSLTMDHLAALKHVFLEDEVLGWVSHDVALWVLGVQNVQLDLVVLPPETDVVLVPLSDVLEERRGTGITPESSACVAAVQRHLPKAVPVERRIEDVEEVLGVRGSGRVLH